MLRLFMTFSGSKINNQQVNLEVSGLIAVLWWRKMFGVQLQVMFTFWFGQYGLTDEHLFCFISLFSLKQQGREKLSMQLRKNWKCCIVIFFSAFFSWYLLYPKLFDLMLNFPRLLLVILSSHLNSCQFFLWSKHSNLMQRWILVSLVVQWILWVLFHLLIITCLQETSKQKCICSPERARQQFVLKMLCLYFDGKIVVDQLVFL